MLQGIPSLMVAKGLPGFSPINIPGLQLWLKADSLVLDDNDTVTFWADSSGNGNNAANTGTPKYKTNIVNGKPVVRFTPANSDGIVVNGGTDIGVSQPNTWFFVVSETSKPAQCVLKWQVAGQIVYMDTSGFIHAYAGSDAADNVDFSGAFHIITVIFSSSTVTLYVDGNLRINAAASGGQSVGNVAMMWDGASTYWQGDVAEYMLYDSDLSSDRVQVEGYLNQEYQIF